MNDERWDNLNKIINDRFEIIEDYEEEIPETDGVGYVGVVVFSTPAGTIKLERYVRPVVLNKKTFYSKRSEGEVAVKYDYSKEETTQNLKIYKLDEINDRWQEINENNIADFLDEGSSLL